MEVVVVVDVVAAVVVLMAEREFLVPQLETTFHEAPKLAICLRPKRFQLVS